MYTDIGSILRVAAKNGFAVLFDALEDGYVGLKV